MKKYDSFFALLFSFFGFILNAQIPIMAFFGVQSTNVDDFKTFRNAGFTISFAIYEDNEQGIKALDAAQKADVKVIYYTDTLAYKPDVTIKLVKNHPALYGYYVFDEPSPKQFNMVKERINNYSRFDDTKMFYVNMHPNYAPKSALQDMSYTSYVESYMRNIPIKTISFDNYPLKNNVIDANWYSNLEVIRTASLKFNKPFWGFANATIFGQYKQPTLAGLKLQQYSNLLYGAKGLQYFTYWTLDTDNWKKSGFSYSIVYSNGKPTPTYAIVKNLNENIQRLAWVFTNSKVTDVHHDGNSIPVDTSKLQSVPEKFSVFNPSKREVLVSQLQNGNRYFVAVQNKNINSSIIFTYKANAGVQIVDSNTGKIKNIKSSQTTSKILPGDLLIFTYTK